VGNYSKTVVKIVT